MVSKRKLLLIIFLLTIFMPIPAMLLTPRQTISLAEKRVLAKIPNMSLNFRSAETLPSGIEAYIQDHFGFRTSLISFHNYIKVKILNKSPNEKVVLGKSGWLFLTEDGLIEDYRGLSHPAPFQIDAFKTHLENKYEWLKHRSVQYLYIISPNKQTVYPEFMPANINRVNKRTRCDVLLEHLMKNFDFPVLDLRPFFLNKKHNTDNLYYLTDAHWNEKGAFLAYIRIMEQVKSYFPDIPVLDMNSIQEKFIRSKGLDSASMLYLSEYYEELIPSLQPLSPHARESGSLKRIGLFEMIPQRRIETINPNGKYTAVVFRDSFCTNLIPYLSESFRKVIYIWSPFKEDMMLNVLEALTPDIVIEQVTERLIGNYYKKYTSYNILGNDMLDNELPLKAVKYFQEALRILPDSPMSYYNLGYAFLKAEKWNWAVNYFNRTLKLNPMHEKAKHFLTIALKKLFLISSDNNNYLKTIAILNRLIDLERKNTEHYYNLACIYSRMNMPAESIKWLNVAIRKGYDNWELIKTDQDLDNIRTADEFKNIMRQEM